MGVNQVVPVFWDKYLSEEGIRPDRKEFKMSAVEQEEASPSTQSELWEESNKDSYLGNLEPERQSEEVGSG